MLDRLETATEGRDPALADLARQLRYRYFDEPVIAARRDATYREVADHLAALAVGAGRADRAERISALVECPQLLAPLLIEPHARG